jgi:TonB family protein
MSAYATAEQLLKDAYPRILRASFLMALLIHAAAFVAVPKLSIAPYRLLEEGPPPLRPLSIAIEAPRRTKEVPKPPKVRAFEPAEDADTNATIDATVVDFEDFGRQPAEERVRPDTFHAFDEPPVIVRRVDPVYPSLAREAELEGSVGLLIVIDELGNVERAEIVVSVPGLDEAAVEAVLKWKFEPARQRNIPVRVRVYQTVRFQLRG